MKESVNIEFQEDSSIVMKMDVIVFVGNMEHSKVCRKCKHLMMEHGIYRNKGYCARGPDCKCDVKGLSYEDALKF